MTNGTTPRVGASIAEAAPTSANNGCVRAPPRLSFSACACSRSKPITSPEVNATIRARNCSLAAIRTPFLPAALVHLQQRIAEKLTARRQRPPHGLAEPLLRAPTRPRLPRPAEPLGRLLGRRSRPDEPAQVHPVPGVQARVPGP